jgi:hypothetical protein
VGYGHDHIYNACNAQSALLSAFHFPFLVQTCFFPSLLLSKSLISKSEAANLTFRHMSNNSEPSRTMEATARDPTPPQVEEAGPLSNMDYDPLETLLAPHHSHPQYPYTQTTSEQNGKQALESHEVMELQAFSERKEWIMEKIRVCIPPLFPLPPSLAA